MADFDDDRLHQMFGEFRNEVAPYVTPPGTAAARHWVRRRRRIGAASIAACAVLFVGGPTVGFVAANHNTPTPPPIGPTVLETPGPSTSTPPSPTPPMPTTTSTSPTGSPTLPGVRGKVFYTDVEGKIYLNGHRYPGGYSANVTVSPDGKRVMWVDLDPSSGDPGGDLMLSDLDGGNRRLAVPNAEPLCATPVWSGDSKRLLVTSNAPAGASMGVIYLSGGAGDDLGEPEGCHYRWSANGKRVAYENGDTRRITVRDLYGGGHRVTLDRDVIGGRQYVDLIGISANGDRVCVNTAPAEGPSGDVGRSLWCDTIIDVSARKVVELPFKGELLSAVFTADGGMLARVKTDRGSELLRLDDNDRVVARSVESSANAKRQLLAYTP
ncbi:hypothetical protein SAMN05421812_110272 [Asanoa hainanensis]|uniref:WD40-like Beta Propeller Repeat n=1 Tax=Asanoa hainanensis TaxID=560556 RepID=A0A239NU50_9ACTN|nr:hypothetical protein [Asanoa hainanensis]SNT58212.1 hypothetical protein SAMN05421812_110272 [Asanoa hainanensis]